MADIRYYTGSQRLTNIRTVPKTVFLSLGGVPSKGNYAGCGEYFAGHIVGDSTYTLYPAERAIEYKRNPSKHECNAKCLNGHVNGRCECRCGGENHGRSAVAVEGAA